MGPLRSSFRWAVPASLLVSLVLLGGMPARAGQLRVGTPAEQRSRLTAVDAQIAEIQQRLRRHGAAASRGDWLLFRADRALRLARLALREARRWGTAPDLIRLSTAGPTGEELHVDLAKDRRRRLIDSPRVGGAIRQNLELQARLTRLLAIRAQIHPSGDRIRATAHPSNAEGWARAFLVELDAPDCFENRLLVVAWQAQESTDARFNPLATTRRMPGATDFNSVGVKNYRSAAQGLSASRRTLELGAASYRYAPIIASLRACDDAEVTAWFVNASAWCRGCTGGAYLTGLIPVVRADYGTFAAR